MKVKLIITKGKDEGRILYVEVGQEVTIGRSRSTEIRLSDTGISRKHCIIANDGKECKLEDLKSSNGTFVNDKRVGDPVSLHDRDTISVGRTTISVRVEKDEAAAPSPAGEGKPSESAAALMGQFEDLLGDKRKKETAGKPSKDEDAGSEEPDTEEDARPRPPAKPRPEPKPKPAEPPKREAQPEHPSSDKGELEWDLEEEGQEDKRDKEPPRHAKAPEPPTRAKEEKAEDGKAGDKEEDDLAGKQVGGYKIMERVATGHSTTVYKAMQLSMDRIVALKVLSSRMAKDPSNVKRFHRGARAGGRVSHPNLVQVYDVGQAEGLYFVAMEFVDGESVQGLITAQGGKRGLDLKTSINAITQIARALRHMHNQKVVHRNVNPENILLAKNGTAKLTNLGLAKAEDGVPQGNVTQPGIALGSYNYVPPEQIYSAADVDRRADIYSLGATLFAMLTGRAPFVADGLRETLNRIRQVKIESPKKYNPDLPDAVCQVIEKAMSKNPDDRHQTIDELLRDLDLVSGRKDRD